jgi:hypothetical protein
MLYPDDGARSPKYVGGKTVCFLHYFVLKIAGFNNKKYFIFKEVNYIKMDNLNSMYIGTNQSINTKKMGLKKRGR